MAETAPDIEDKVDGQKPPFDPNKPFEKVNGKKPAFDPNKPFEEVKKKEGGGQSQPSPSAPSPAPTAKVEKPAPSASELPSLHDNIFGVTHPSQKPTGKEQLHGKAAPPAVDPLVKETQSFIDKPTLEETKDDKTSLVGKVAKVYEDKVYSSRQAGLTEEEKFEINQRKKQLTNHFMDGELTGEDMKWVHGAVAPGVKDLQAGLTDDQIATAINNKTKNLRDAASAPIKRGIQNYVDEIGKIDDLLGKTLNETDKKNLQDKKDLMKRSLTKMYDHEIHKVVPDLIEGLRSGYGNKSWNEIMEGSEKSTKIETHKDFISQFEKGSAPDIYQTGIIEFDKRSHTLTPESTQAVLRYVDDKLNKMNNPVINAQTSGNADEKQRNYSDAGKAVVDYLNTHIPVDYNNKKFADEYTNKHPEVKPWVDHIQDISSSLSKENFDAAQAYANTWRDKQFVITHEKYLGKNGVLIQSPGFVEIQNKYAERVSKGLISDKLAQQQMMQEIKSNAELKPIYDNYQKDIMTARSKTADMWANFLTKAISKTAPGIEVQPDGSIVLKGKTWDESKKIIDGYNDGLSKTTAETLHTQQKKLMLDADKRAKRLGTFESNLKEAGNNMAQSLYKWWFDKTGYGGEDVRLYQAKDLSTIPETASDEAKKWNWEGLRSLLNPDYYLASLGGQVPVLAGATLATAATEGAGLPEYISWIASAGLFTANDALETYSRLANNGTDAYGNKLTQAEASEAAANVARDTFLPNLGFMVLNFNTLARAKGIAKPSIGKEIIKGGIESAAGAIPMAAQGYLSYVNEQQAQGKSTDFWDYMQDPAFANSMINGVVAGSMLHLAHLPGKYSKMTQNWKELIKSGDNEFKRNSLFQVAMQHEMDGNGNPWRDQLKLSILQGGPQKEQAQQVLAYSTALERNAKGAGIDVSTAEGAYQAHNLAMADLHDTWAEQNKDNKNLSKIYSDQAKDFREKAKNAMEGKGEYHYLIDEGGNPIFISDESFQALDKSGTLNEWFDKGQIQDIRSSTDPDFGEKYKKLQKKTAEVKAVEPYKSEHTPEDGQKIISVLKSNEEDLKKGGMPILVSAIADEKLHNQAIDFVISQGVDNPETLKKIIGDKAFTEIEPILKEQREKAQQQRDGEKYRKPEEIEKIIGEKVPPELMDKQIEVDRGGEKPVKITAKVELARLKNLHERIADLIDCITA